MSRLLLSIVNYRIINKYRQKNILNPPWVLRASESLVESLAIKVCPKISGINLVTTSKYMSLFLATNAALPL